MLQTPKMTLSTRYTEQCIKILKQQLNLSTITSFYTDDLMSFFLNPLAPDHSYFGLDTPRNEILDAVRNVYINGSPNFQTYLWTKKHLTGTDILDIGCAEGCGSQILKNIEGLRYLGIDIDPLRIAYAKSRFETDGPKIKFEIQDILSYDWPTKKYDTILVYEMLENEPFGPTLVTELRKHCDTLLSTADMPGVDKVFKKHTDTENFELFILRNNSLIVPQLFLAAKNDITEEEKDFIEKTFKIKKLKKITKNIYGLVDKKEIMYKGDKHDL